MIELTHHDDMNGKHNSLIATKTERDFYNAGIYVCTHKPFEINGLGVIKEDALEDFKINLNMLCENFDDDEKIIFDTFGNILSDTNEVDLNDEVEVGDEE